MDNQKRKWQKKTMNFRSPTARHISKGKQVREGKAVLPPLVATSCYPCFKPSDKINLFMQKQSN